MVTIKEGIRHEVDKYLPPKHRAVVLSDDQVGPLYAKTVAEKLHCPLLTFPAGEKSKTREMKERLEDQLIDTGYGRDTVIIGVGGGVVTDLVGFLASTYCRGVPLILMPTSLLAMVDASIGGKTGVNVAKSKNFIGSIYFPKKILIDPETLLTQPFTSYCDGFVEMIKHGLIWDRSLFEWMEIHLDRLLRKDMALLEEAIRKNCHIKMEIIENDRYENGVRRVLNFGHTIGHAIEVVSDYEVSHGHAVAIGCLVEGSLSSLPQKDLARLVHLFRRIGFSFSFPTHDLIKAMMLDKKAIDNTPRFVTLKAIGKAHAHEGKYCISFPKKTIENAIEWISQDLCRLIWS